ncbi:MAG TPA: DNA mismatch repair protein MutS [Clostridia bacterium]|nr:DNA mismatch repair protein MutS [Clostridia bacterium]
MAFSPMMTHYLTVKEQYPDCILLYRLGDFYEMFFDDAVKASEILDLVLTGRDCGDSKRAPMCGVPYHAVDTYIAKLITKGIKVAVCEQMTEPMPGKMVEREVTRVITPGTVVENTILDEKSNNFICSLTIDGINCGCAFCDISTGEFFAYELIEPNLFQKIQDLLVTFCPSEIISDEKTTFINETLPVIKAGKIVKAEFYQNTVFEYKRALNSIKNHYKINDIKAFGLENSTQAVCACGALIEYFLDTQKRELGHLHPIKLASNSEYMSIDFNTRRNLELSVSGRDQKRKGSLIWLLDQTRTSMGGRTLAAWLERPLLDPVKINARLDAVTEFTSNYIFRDTLDNILGEIKDIERLTAKLSYNTISPRDLNALQISLSALPKIKKTLSGCVSPFLHQLNTQIVDVTDIEKLIFTAICENAPLVTKDGGFIKKGYNAELDKLLELSKNSKYMIAALEEKERERTGIKTLRVGYNKVFGYYFEITNSYKHLAPIDFIRKQTLTNGERYVSPELKDLEEAILSADEKSLALEKQLYAELREKLLVYIPQFQQIANAIANIDALLSFAKVSVKRNYIKPQINSEDSTLQIIDGRHPIVESFLKTGEFIPNDTFLDTDSNRTMVITGPNMAGKSTYMRQVALITLMAHIGCFVPAKTAVIPIVDKIFTRVGASDDISFNQSTFMVEMVEVANIINNATPKSLIILDEVGRGTATFDGLSIAWAVLEFISEKITAKTLFATHFHELTELEGRVSGVKNYKISVKEINDNIVFLRKITRGGASRSFGIEVAALAGVPKPIINKAKQISKLLEQHDIVPLKSEETQSLAHKEMQVINVLKTVNIENSSPLKAFEILKELVDMLNTK